MRYFYDIMGYPKAVYITLMTMGIHYLENIFTWIKAAVWDAPHRLYLDVQLEKMKIERDQFLSETNPSEIKEECSTTTSHS